MAVTTTPRPASGVARAYEGALQQVEAELEWLMLRLRVVVEEGRRLRALGPAEEHRGIYVSDEEIDELLAERAHPDAVDIDALRRRAAEMRASLDRRAAATEAGGAELPLERATRAFGFAREERLALVATLATHFDRSYEKVFAYANDDVTRKNPTVGVVLDLLTDDRAEALRLRSIFSPAAPLTVHRLVSTVDDHSTPAGSLLAASLRMADHVASVLLGGGGLDPALHGVAEMLDGPASAAGGPLAAVLRRRRDSRVYIGGRWWAEKRAAVASACGSLGLATIRVDTAALHDADNQASLLRLLARDARLTGAALYFERWGADGGDAEREAGAETLGRRLQREFEGHPLPLILSGRTARSSTPEPRLHLEVEQPAPSFEDRRREWAAAEASDRDDDGGDGGGGAERLAATFRLGSHEIGAALRMARSLADWRGEQAVSLDDLLAAARLQSQPRLSDVARRVEPHFGWDDIVLPAERVAQLKEIATQALYQHVVYEQWGFAAKASLGRGVASLFVGDPGTGKTMAAEIIAADLGLDLYKIDLSGLVSKYIGETEKNLARVFDEAGDSNAILFFDEADAIFGKRTEVRDSHDRYANIEVSYLLQKMEEYDGIVVLASNLRANLDDAFLRRLKAIIDFPFPEEEDRLEIYRRMLAGTTAPLADDVDLPFMARQFRISGGNIKNIVVLAAFLAAESGSAIAMHHLIHATRREYQKLGRLLTESDFADWYEEVHA